MKLASAVTERGSVTLRRGACRGYTVVELLMALAVLAIGLGGVIAMQKVTVASNAHAKNLAIATHIAESWLDELAAEAGQWNDTNDWNETHWLSNVGDEDGVPGVWFRPQFEQLRNFGPAFDALGNPVATDDIADDAHFCSDLRLRWMSPQETSKRGAGLIRAEVRVYWRRHGVVGLTGTAPTHVCDVTPLEFDGDDGRRLFHVVYLSTALRQHMGGLPE